ncbi:hypothetical protein P171DRAFT_449820 [Karstenula rhodostoma CBS 690.94]|uniref:Uncharacterized protein n=1 Tax=Karstenula rhodostoma CBS 690.94 TaxID=1392251 RepID=A0A9P4P596_9PLEO|nr:hypothetical protein P171DRAFT_449820 [Karstenula rhodostoma CBS 690.94]
MSRPSSAAGIHPTPIHHPEADQEDIEGTLSDVQRVYLNRLIRTKDDEVTFLRDLVRDSMAQAVRAQNEHIAKLEQQVTRALTALANIDASNGAQDLSLLRKIGAKMWTGFISFFRRCYDHRYLLLIGGMFLVLLYMQPTLLGHAVAHITIALLDISRPMWDVLPRRVKISILTFIGVVLAILEGNDYFYQLKVLFDTQIDHSPNGNDPGLHSRGDLWIRFLKMRQVQRWALQALDG